MYRALVRPSQPTPFHLNANCANTAKMVQKHCQGTPILRPPFVWGCVVQMLVLITYGPMLGRHVMMFIK